MPYMTRIGADLLAAGLDVEYVPGWETRGSSSFAPGGVVNHWTAGPRGTRGRPSLRVVTEGRPGLPGPLCNVYLARTGTCVIVAAGRANHAGAGSWRGLVGNSAVYGIEAESAGDNDWTAAMRDVYPVLNAALLRGIGRGAEWACGHNEWAPSRKVDIRDWPMPLMRQQVAAILSTRQMSNTLVVRGHLITPAVPGLPASLDPYSQEDSMIPFIQAMYLRWLDRPGNTSEWAGWADRFQKERVTSYVEAERRFREAPAEAGTVRAAFRLHLGREAEDTALAHAQGRNIGQVFELIRTTPEARLRRGETV